MNAHLQAAGNGCFITWVLASAAFVENWQRRWRQVGLDLMGPQHKRRTEELLGGWNAGPILKTPAVCAGLARSCGRRARAAGTEPGGDSCFARTQAGAAFSRHRSRRVEGGAWGS